MQAFKLQVLQNELAVSEVASLQELGCGCARFHGNSRFSRPLPSNHEGRGHKLMHAFLATYTRVTAAVFSYRAPPAVASGSLIVWCGLGGVLVDSQAEFRSSGGSFADGRAVASSTPCTVARRLRIRLPTPRSEQRNGSLAEIFLIREHRVAAQWPPL